MSGSMTAPHTAKNAVPPAPWTITPPRTGPTTWPMFHWKLSTLMATGMSSGRTRFPTVVHHEGEDVPLAMPMPATPMSSVVGERRCAAETRRRKATEPASRSLANSSTTRRSRESATAPEKATARMPASGLMSVARATSTGEVVRRSMM